MLAEAVLAAPPLSYSIRRDSEDLHLSADFKDLAENISPRIKSPIATPTTAAAKEMISCVAGSAATRRFRRSGSMTEDEAATIICAAERGRRARRAHQLRETSVKVAQIAQRKASWVAAHAKSKALLVTNEISSKALLVANVLSPAPLRNPRSPSTSSEVSTGVESPAQCDDGLEQRSMSKLARKFRETYFSACPSHASLPPLRPPEARRKFHIYCSAHNTGARTLLLELHAEMRRRGLPPTALLWTEDASAMGQCEHFLLLCAWQNTGSNHSLPSKPTHLLLRLNLCCAQTRRAHLDQRRGV